MPPYSTIKVLQGKKKGDKIKNYMVPNQGISASGNIGTKNSKKPSPSEHLECLIKYNKHTLNCTAELIRHKQP